MDGNSGEPAAPSPPERTYLTHVEGMRAAAALVVCVNHAYAQIWNPIHDRYPTGILSGFTYFLVYGHLSVTVFIVISGFCLTLPVVSGGGTIRGGAKSFFRRRARRILPPYYAAVTICVLLIATILGAPTGTIWDVPIRMTASSIVSHILLLQDFYGTGSINYVFWSIAVEWQIYFLFPLLVWAYRRSGPVVTVCIAMLTGYALELGLGSTRIARANPQYLGMFCLGMLAAYVVRSKDDLYARWRSSALWPIAAASTFLLVGVLTVLWGHRDAFARIHWLDLPVGLMAAAALVVSSRSPTSALRRVFSWKPLAFIGTFSYSLYLVHAPLLQLLWLYGLRALDIGDAAKFGLLMTLGMVILLGAAYLFFRAFEAPFMRSGSGEGRRAVAIPMPSS